MAPSTTEVLYLRLPTDLTEWVRTVAEAEARTINATARILLEEARQHRTNEQQGGDRE